MRCEGVVNDISQQRMVVKPTHPPTHTSNLAHARAYQGGDAPDICALIVVVAEDGLETTVLARLDHGRKVLVL